MLGTEEAMMTRRLFPMLVVGFSALTLAAACGGGGGEDAHDAGAMDHAGAMDEGAHGAEGEAEPGAAEMAMVGGGHATLVHEGQAGSPHVTAHWSVNDANLTISYGRPYLKGRVVGESVPPMADGVWRLGADEATTLTTDTGLMLGGTHVPAGEYTLWTAHMNDEFHLIVNSETGQWGTAYNSEHDVAHIAMEVGQLDPPAEQLVISIADGTLGFDWGAMTATVTLMAH